MKTISFVLAFGATCAALADGLQNWQWRNPLPHGNTLEAVSYADGRFLAVGYNGAMMTSTNGVHWTARQSGTRNPFWGATYGNGIFVAVSIDLAANGC